MASRASLPDGLQQRLQAGHMDEALTLAQDCVARAPDQSQHWAWLGQVHMRQFNHEAAVTAFQRALSLQPDDLRAMLSLAAAYIEMREHAKALPWLNHALAHPHLPPQGWHRAADHLVRVYACLGQLAPARALLDHAKRRTAQLPDHVVAWIPQAQWRLQERWRESVDGRRLRLRRMTEADADWLKAAFSDPAFASAVHREYAQRLNAVHPELLARHLRHQWDRSPVDEGGALWLVEPLDREADSTPLGLVSLVGVDESERRCEFIMGFPEPITASPVVMEAGMLMADLVFNRLRMNKAQACIYADNPRSKGLLRMLQRFGFALCAEQPAPAPVDGSLMRVHQLQVERDVFMAQDHVHRMFTRLLSRAMPSESP